MFSKNQRKVSLKDHVKKALSSFNLKFSIIISISLTALIVAGTYFVKNKEMSNFASKTANVVTMMVREGSIVEAQRLISLLRGDDEIDIEIESNGIILASTLNTSRIHGPSSQGDLSGYLENSAALEGRTQGRVIVFHPLKNMLLRSLILGLILFFLVYWIISHSLSKNIDTTNKALGPLVKLSESIRGLKEFKKDQIVSSFEIMELDEISSKIGEVQKELKETHDKMVEAEAYRLSSDSYQRLLHDLHNPIAALSNLVTSLGNKDISLEKKEKAIKMAQDTGNQILSQIKSAKKNLEIKIKIQENQDLRKCVQEAINIVKLAAPSSKKVRLISDVKNKVVAHCDPFNLNRAITNILTNAFEACESQVSIVLGRDESGKASIKIEDDGPGMDLSEVNLHFSGAGKSTKSPRQGIGISSSGHIVSSHGGKLFYAPSDMGGACFEILI